MTIPDAADPLEGMRVLAFCDYYTPTSSGGAERVAHEIYTRLASRGAKLTVLSAVTDAPYEDAGVQVIPFGSVDLSKIVGAQLVVSPTLHVSARGTARLTRPDVVHVHGLHFHGSVVGAQVARSLRMPVVSIAHVAGIDHLTGATRGLAEIQERLLARFILRSSTTVACVSAAVRDHVIRRGASPHRAVVVPNGVDHDRFHPSPLPRTALPQVLFVGRLIANKGPDVLLRAAEMLWQRGLCFNLTMVGDGPMLESMRAASRRQPALEVVGASRDVPGWLKRADIVVRPSLTEGQPLTVLEAMASGRPVIASSIPANVELVRDAQNGWTHRAGDAADLARVLEVALKDRALRERLGTNAARHAETFSWDATADGHGRLLAQAARGELAWRRDERRFSQRAAVDVLARTVNAGSAGPTQSSHSPGP